MRPKRELSALLAAAMAYAEATEQGQSEPLAGMQTAVALKHET